MSIKHLRTVQFTWSQGSLPTACEGDRKRKNTTWHPKYVTCKRCIESELYEKLVAKIIAERMKGVYEYEYNTPT